MRQYRVWWDKFEEEVVGGCPDGLNGHIRPPNPIFVCHSAQGGRQTQEYSGRFPKRQLVSYFFFSPTGAPRKSSKCLPEVRWGGPGAAQRRQGQSRGACGARDGSGLVLMGPRHATGGHMCHGPGRPSGVNAAPHRPPEPRMPAQGPTNEPPSGPHIHCDRPTRSLAPLAPHPLLAAPAAPKSRSTRPWRDRESA